MKLLKRLTRDRARSEPLPGTLTLRSSLAGALRLMRETRASALPVIDEGHYRGVVVIAAGCTPCAKRMVARALEQGSSPRQVRKALALVKHMRRLA